MGWLGVAKELLATTPCWWEGNCRFGDTFVTRCRLRYSACISQRRLHGLLELPDALPVLAFAREKRQELIVPVLSGCRAWKRRPFQTVIRHVSQAWDVHVQSPQTVLNAFSVAVPTMGELFKPLFLLTDFLKRNNQVFFRYFSNNYSRAFTLIFRTVMPVRAYIACS